MGLHGRTMDPQIPTDARLASRVILIDSLDRVLFFKAVEPSTGHAFWVMPGGGLEAGETFEQAAARELGEETGISAMVGPCVWYRRHRHRWNGQDTDQFEKFFIVRLLAAASISGENPDSYTGKPRWWSLEELSGSNEEFAPRNSAQLLPAILKGDFAAYPIDCGI